MENVSATSVQRVVIFINLLFLIFYLNVKYNKKNPHNKINNKTQSESMHP